MVKVPDLAEMVVRGVLKNLGQVFNLPPDAVNFYTSSNRMQLALRLEELLKTPNKTITWPKMFAHVTTVQLAEIGTDTAYVPKQLARHGINVSVDDSGSKVVNVKIVPTTFAMEITFMTDDFFRAFKFATSWVRHSIANDVNFSVTYGGENIDIPVRLDPSVTTPDRDEAVNHPNTYEYTANLSVWGYSNDENARELPILDDLVTGVIPAMPPVAVSQAFSATKL